MKKFEEVFHTNVIEARVKEELRSFVHDFKGDSLMFGADYYDTRITTLVSGSYGCNIPYCVCDLLGVTPQSIDKDVMVNDEDADLYWNNDKNEWMTAEEWIKSYEWIHDYMADMEFEFCFKFNEHLRSSNILGYVYLGYAETDGDYCLMYAVDSSYVEDIRNGLECVCNNCDNEFKYGDMVELAVGDFDIKTDGICPICDSLDWEYSY